MKGIAEFYQQIFGVFFFNIKLYLFFKSATKKVAYLKVLGRDMKIYFFFTFKIKLVILLSWIRPGSGSGSALTKFCGSGSAFDQCGSTSLHPDEQMN